MEETRQTTMEMAQEEDAPQEAGAKDAQGVAITRGVWGNTASSRAPVNWV